MAEVPVALADREIVRGGALMGSSELRRLARARGWLPVVSLLWLGCEAGSTKYIGSHRPPSAPDACSEPSPPPPELGLDPFYTKYLDARGVPILSSEAVPDAALLQACDIVVHLLTLGEAIREAMVESELRVAVIGTGELLTQMPEYRDLYNAFPDTDWDRLRGVGATRARPVSSCGEENLLCAVEDTNRGETILVHSFAHAIRSLGLLPTDPTFDVRLTAAYDDAMANGRYASTFAARNPAQYWAEGVQAWFDANLGVSPPDGVHNEIDTRAELITYDPALAALVGEVFPNDAWRPLCP